MKSKDKIIFLLLTLTGFFWLTYLVKSALAPFIFSLIIAYFLDPLVDYLNKKYKLSRLAATSLILVLFLTLLVSIFSILMPIIYQQFVDLVNTLPDYLQIVTSDFYPKIAATLNKFGFKLDDDFYSLTQDQELTGKFVDFSKNFFGSAIESSFTFVNILSLIFITPLLVFYLLKDWDILIEKIDDYLPRQSSSTARKIAKDIDKTLSGYVHGQFNVCFILGIIYSGLLSVAGLNFGFLIGFLTGLFSFIPFVGMLCGITTAIVVALFQWGFDVGHISSISLIFIFGQIIESHFLTPKLIGAKIGLHPVWIIFGLFVFGALFGFIGVLIAVPLTAICGVIIRHFALEYKKRFT